MKRKNKQQRHLPVLMIEEGRLSSLAAVLYNVQMHADTWQDCDDTVWLAGLLGEVAEVGHRMAFAHRGFSEPGEPQEQLVRVAGICLNWLRKLEEKKS